MSIGELAAIFGLITSFIIAVCKVGYMIYAELKEIRSELSKIREERVSHRVCQNRQKQFKHEIKMFFKEFIS